MLQFIKQAQALKAQTKSQYAVFGIVDHLAQEITQEKEKKIKHLTRQYELGLEPDCNEIARAIGKYLKKIS